MAGFGIGVAAIVGLLVALCTKYRKTRWAAIAVWILCATLAYALTPIDAHSRHMTVLLPMWLMLALLGMHWLSSRLPTLAWKKAHVIPVLAILLFVPEFSFEKKHVHGYEAAVEMLLDDVSLADAAFLIESDATGEGGFITAVALREDRPGHIVLRGSKILGSSDWMGTSYTPRFETTYELGEYLAQVPVEIVAIEDSTARRHRHEHVDQLLEAVQSKPETWTRIGTFDLERENGSFPQSLTLYRQRLPEDHPAPNITFDDVIGREVPY